MKTENDIHGYKIIRMKERHVREVFQLSQESNLSFWSFEDYQLESVRADSLCLVAENYDHRVAGFLVARLIMQMDCAELYNIAVKDLYKKKEIGKNLLKHLIKHCVINKLDRVNLEVRESNLPAISLYSKAGFKKISISKNFYKMPTENAITMTKDLNSAKPAE